MQSQNRNSLESCTLHDEMKLFSLALMEYKMIFLVGSLTLWAKFKWTQLWLIYDINSYGCSECTFDDQTALMKNATALVMSFIVLTASDTVSDLFTCLDCAKLSRTS